MEYRLSVGLKEFRLALGRFKTRKKVRVRERAMLGFDGSFLSIEAIGLVAAMHAEGQWPGVAVIPAEYITTLARVPPKLDPVVLTCDGARVKIETISFPCTWQPVSNILLEMDGAPEWVQALLLKYRRTRGEILANKLQPKIDDAERQLEKLLRRTAKHLAPLGVTIDDLRKLIELRLQKH
ncbi:MAG: hypothetical protein WA373_09625 [Burkholderiales bacterium]